MVTEDYVSFEIAKLLKEKGFDEIAEKYFLVHKSGFAEPFDKIDNYPYPEDNWIKRPTLQMAMKWLREKHDIVCSVSLFTDLLEMPPYWSFNILNQSTANVMYEAFDVKCKTYEEACESAIKYCLENLI